MDVAPVRPFGRSAVRPFARSPVRPFASSPVRSLPHTRPSAKPNPPLPSSRRTPGPTVTADPAISPHHRPVRDHGSGVRRDDGGRERNNWAQSGVACTKRPTTPDNARQRPTTPVKPESPRPNDTARLLVLPRRREPSLGPRLRGETFLARHRICPLHRLSPSAPGSSSRYPKPKTRKVPPPAPTGTNP